MISNVQLKNKIYKRYSFLNIEEEYNKIFNEIEKKYGYEDIENALVKRLDKECKRLFEKDPLLITNNFIRTNFKHGSSYSTYLLNITLLAEFFGKMSYLPDLSFFELLYQNEEFKKNINAVVNANIEIIKKGKVDEYFDNEILIFMIDGYCSINNIEIDEQDLILEDNIKHDVAKQYLIDICKRPLLTADEQKDLLLRIRNGDESAKNKFIEANLMLVPGIAGKYMNRGLQFLDLIQEGNLGLMEAVNNFDINRGYSFSTYAIFYIKGHILRAIQNYGNIVRTPSYLQDLIPKYKTLLAIFERNLNRKPTYEELATELKVPVNLIKNLEADMSNSVVSMNERINDDSDDEIGEFIPDENSNFEENIEKICLRNDLLNLIDQCGLSDRNKEILMLYFGINGIRLNMSELSKKYNISRQRIDQLISKSLKKIRKFKDIKKLTCYLDNPDKANLGIRALGYAYYAMDNMDDAEKDEIISTLYDLQDNILYIDSLSINDNISFLQKTFPKVSPIILQIFKDCKLSDDEAKILILKHGFDDYKIYDIEEICKKFHLTSKVVQKLELRALSKIKDSIYFKNKVMIKRRQIDE